MVSSWVETIPQPGFALDKLFFVLPLDFSRLFCSILSLESLLFTVHQGSKASESTRFCARRDLASCRQGSRPIMEHSISNRSEISPGKKVLLLLLCAAFLAALHVSCLFFSNVCPICSVSGNAHPIFNLDEASPSGGYGAFDSVGIYAFTSIATTVKSAGSSSGTLGADASTSLKPFYNSKVRDDEHLVPSNLKLKKLWTSKDWRLKVSTFTDLFSDMMKKDLLMPCGKALCIGAGQGQEVLALKEMGIFKSIGIDLVAAPPLVMKGDMHSQPFRRNTFDFEFCNVFDHALFTSKFASEIERTLKPGGCVVIHLMLKNRTGEAYRSNDLQSVDVLTDLFRSFDTLHVGTIDAFGLNTEVIFRKPHLPTT